MLTTNNAIATILTTTPKLENTMDATRFDSMSLRQKAYYPFTDEEWNSMDKGMKKRVFFARKKFKEQQQQS